MLVAGLLNSAKGQDLAVEAFAAADLVARPDVQLVFAGHGEDRPALEAQIERRGMADRVHLLGWRDDLPGLMAMADLLLLPSRWEGMPYVVLEAMAAGKPVVATRVDGARDLVVDAGEAATGRLVDVGDTAAMAGALVELVELDADARGRLGAAGAERIAAGFTIEHMVAGTRAVFHEAIEAHS